MSQLSKAIEERQALIKAQEKERADRAKLNKDRLREAIEPFNQLLKQLHEEGWRAARPNHRISVNCEAYSGVCATQSITSRDFRTFQARATGSLGVVVFWLNEQSIEPDLLREKILDFVALHYVMEEAE